VIALVAFVFKDRIADGPFPSLSQGIRYFEEHETAMNTYVHRLENDNQVEEVSCYTDSIGVVEGNDGGYVQLSGQRLTEYLNLCHESGGYMTRRVDGGYLLYFGWDSRSGRDFNIAFIWRDNEVDGAPECSSVDDLRDFGKCTVPLSDEWVLDYEWRPSDYESTREKELMELAKDVAGDLAEERTSNP
jgi:hypothetical protein